MAPLLSEAAVKAFDAAAGLGFAAESETGCEVVMTALALRAGGGLLTSVMVARFDAASGLGQGRAGVHATAGAIGAAATKRSPTLRSLSVEESGDHPADPVWSTDITFVPIVGGFADRCAVIAWYSPAILSWELPKNSLPPAACRPWPGRWRAAARQRSSVPTKAVS